jgi:hypothetical protein
MMILPRQARDKHREKLKKRVAFSLRSMVLLQVIGNLGCVYLVVITALICFGAMPGCNPPAATSGSTAGGGGFDDYQGLELELALDPVMSDLQSVTHAGNHTPPAPEHRSALACGGEPEVVPPVKYLEWDLNWNGAGKHIFVRPLSYDRKTTICQDRLWTHAYQNNS